MKVRRARKPRQPDPWWQTVLHVALTIVTANIAVPAARDGDWLWVAVALVGLIVVEVVVILVVQHVQRRRRRRAPQV